VLIVGGAAGQLASARTVLNDAGFDVEARSEAFGILAWIVREQPEVVLLDPALAPLGAREIVPMVRGDASTRDVILLLWTDGAIHLCSTGPRASRGTPRA
jgi:PleD family two-component response regulator